MLSYYRSGRILDLHSKMYISLSINWKDLLMSPVLWFAFEVVLFIWSLNVRSRSYVNTFSSVIVFKEIT